MLEEWLVDGFNLLHHLTSRLNQKNKLSKESLFNLLANFSASSDGRHVIVVLDGIGSDQELEPFYTASFQAFYSQKVSADTCIERYLYEKKTAMRLMVVTKDRAIATMARGYGAGVVSPDAFMEMLRENKSENSDILFKQKVKSRGFHRPFEDKI